MSEYEIPLHWHLHDLKKLGEFFAKLQNLPAKPDLEIYSQHTVNPPYTSIRVIATGEIFMSTAPTPVDSIAAEMQPLFDMINAQMGFIPNSFLTMAKRPALLQAFMPLAGYIFGETFNIEPTIRQMAAYMASYGSGCRYCQAHTSHSAEKTGLSGEKIANLWQFETSDLFDAREKAVCAFALAAGQTPNTVTDDHYAALNQFFTEEEIIDLVAVISLFGFFNRWNDTLGTTLEAEPAEFAESSLAHSGWEPGKHK
jgi:uncharacterized peroxidase-related enzyme